MGAGGLTGRYNSRTGRSLAWPRRWDAS